MSRFEFRAWNPNRNGFTTIQLPEKDSMQASTGLVDKNGKPIYEEDVVRYGLSFPDTLKVEWIDKAAAFYLVPTKDKDYRDPIQLGRANMNYLEIIGNMYELPKQTTKDKKT